MGLTVEQISAAQIGYLPGELGIEWMSAEEGLVTGRLQVERRHLASTGYLHAAAVVALADTACGYGCLASLPPRVIGFTTAELKSNYLGTARDGAVTCEARAVHRGRTTQVWGRARRDRGHRQDDRAVSLHADPPVPDRASSLIAQPVASAAH